MSAEYSKILRKGLQSALENSTIERCALKFTIDTKRLYVDVDGTSRVQITDVIFGMTEAEIKANQNLLSKFYVASDTLKVFISDGNSLEEIVSDFIPTEIATTETQNYYPVMRSADSTTNTKGFSTAFKFNPKTKETTIGNVKISQSIDENNDKVIDFYII